MLIFGDLENTFILIAFWIISKNSRMFYVIEQDTKNSQQGVIYNVTLKNL